MATKVFVYGSLLRGLHNAHHLRTSTLLLPGAKTVASYVLIDSANGYPFAIHAEAGPRFSTASAPVIGEVYEVSDGVLAALDELEGHPSFYRRELINVARGAGQHVGETAWMYFLHDAALLEAVGADCQRYPEVIPAGDWRLWHAAGGDADAARAAAAARDAAWPTTRRTATPAVRRRSAARTAAEQHCPGCKDGTSGRSTRRRLRRRPSPREPNQGREQQQQQRGRPVPCARPVACSDVRVEDHGGGWPAGSDARGALRFLHTTNPPRGRPKGAVRPVRRQRLICPAGASQGSGRSYGSQSAA